MKSKDLALGRETINHGVFEVVLTSSRCLLPAACCWFYQPTSYHRRLPISNAQHEQRQQQARITRISDRDPEPLSVVEQRDAVACTVLHRMIDRKSTQARRLTHGTDGGGKESRILPHAASGGPCRCRYLSLERVATARTVVTRPVRTF